MSAIPVTPYMLGLVAGAVLQQRPDIDPRDLTALCWGLEGRHPTQPLCTMVGRLDERFRRFRLILDAAIGATVEDLHRGERQIAVFLLRGYDEDLPDWASDALHGWTIHKGWGVRLPDPHPWLAAERARRAACRQHDSKTTAQRRHNRPRKRGGVKTPGRAMPDYYATTRGCPPFYPLYEVTETTIKVVASTVGKANWLSYPRRDALPAHFVKLDAGTLDAAIAAAERFYRDLPAPAETVAENA